MFQEKAMELVAALRSGSYRQGFKVLRRVDNSFCCLGVACDIAKVTPWHDEPELGSPYYEIGVERKYGSMPKLVMNHFGFYGSSGNVQPSQPPLQTSKGEFSCLADANDAGVPFTEIADLIEQRWEDL